jgi:hypothetical protein
MIAWFLIPAGILMIVYAEKVGSFTGEISFGEKIFGGGGTYTLIKVVGLLLSVFAFMWIVGGLDGFVYGGLKKFVPGVN